MKKWMLFFLLVFAPRLFAQTDPLNSAYAPVLDTNCSHSQYAPNIWMDSGQSFTQPTQKLFQNTGGVVANSCTMTIFGVANEFVDLQVHLHDTGSGTPNYSVTISNLVCNTGPKCVTPQTINCATGTLEKCIVYRESYQHVTTPSSSAHPGAPTYINTFLLAAGGSGFIPDILIPTVDPYFGQTTNAFPFTIVAGNNQSAWIDVLIPPTASSGYYQGTVTVTSGVTTLATMPVVIGVWQWPVAQGGQMPAQATLKSYFPTGEHDFCEQTYGGASTASCSAYPGSGGNGDVGAALTIVDHARMFVDHRMSADNPLYFSQFTGTPFWNFVVAHTGPLLNGTGATIIPGAKMTQGINWGAEHFNGATGMQDWATNFSANGWTNRWMYYGCDEPPNGCSFATLPTEAALAHGATPIASKLVTTDITALNTNSVATCGTAGCLGTSVDIMASIINNVDPCPTTQSGCFMGSPYGPWPTIQPAINTWLAGSCCGAGSPPRQQWYYLDNESSPPPNSFTSSWPNWTVDGTPTANRAMEWLTFLHNGTGELYFATTICFTATCPSVVDPWQGGPYQQGENGAGTLVYPGRQIGSPAGASGIVGVTTPIWLPSLRLKIVRDGFQDFEYLNALTVAGKNSVALAHISSWITNSTTFNNTSAPVSGVFTETLPQARFNLGQALHQLTFGQLWNGIISNASNGARAIDWTQSGIPGGIPPEITGSWPQCAGSPISPANESGTVINSLVTAATPPCYFQWQAGTWNLTDYLLIGRSQIVHKGMGASQTIVKLSGPANLPATPCNTGFSAVIGLCGPDSSNQVNGSGPVNNTTWTAGYAQGSTQITLGTTPTGLHFVGSTTPTIVYLSQCEDGYTGFPCVGFNLDNGNYFDCAEKYASQWNGSTVYQSGLPSVLSAGAQYRYTGPTGTSTAPPGVNWVQEIASGMPTTGSVGCSGGPDVTPHANWVFRQQYEQALIVSQAGNVLTLDRPLQHFNWRLSQTPMIWWATGMEQSGFENMTLDTTGITTGGYNDIEMLDCYQCFVSGVTILPVSIRGIDMQWSLNPLIKDNYLYNGLTTDPYGIRGVNLCDSLIQNNIFQRIRTSIVYDGPGCGNVVAYNYSVNQKSNSPGNMWQCFWEHSDDNDFDLFEGNFCDGLKSDQIHGKHSPTTMYRNFLTGWESCANNLATDCNGSVKTGQTIALEVDAWDRYANLIGNIIGTPGYTTIYQTNSDIFGAHYAYAIGAGNGNYTQPFDPLTSTTGMRWGNWDSVTGPLIPGPRWCGGPSDTNWSNVNGCNSTSEVPSTISPYPNPIPTFGDTVAGQGVMPPSFYLVAKPSWFRSDPWPPIGPDVSGGNIGQCAGTLNTAGKFNGLPASNASQCAGSALTANAWAGQVNSIPARDAFIFFGGNIDGTSTAIPFDASFYSGSASPTVTLTPSSLAFGNQNINTTSAGMTATLTNIGTLPVVVSNVVVTGNFSNTGTGTCAGTSFTLAVGSSCTFIVTFTPTATTTYSGSLSVTDNAAGSPQVVSLSGTGTVPAITWSSPQGGTTYNFGNVLAGTNANSSNLTLQNTGNGPLNIGLSITGANAAQFSIFSSTCPNPLPAGNSCVVVVQFSPTAAASYTAFLTETDSVQSLTANLTLNGVGVTSVPVTAPWPPILLSWRVQ